MWRNLHISPRSAPSARYNFCTDLRWFARPGSVSADRYFEMPISLFKLRRLIQFRVGSHSLPIKRGRMARPVIPTFLQRCTLCRQHAPGDERHHMLECPFFDRARTRFAHLLHDAHDSMRSLMWHKHQRGVADLIIAILDEADMIMTRPHRPCWLNGRSELSFLLSIHILLSSQDPLCSFENQLCSKRHAHSDRSRN